jgi:ABC-type sugar transport system substrate-binding protein
MADCGMTLTLSTDASGGDRSTGRSIMAAYLGETRDIQGVFALSDEMAIGAIEAIKAAGLKAGRDIQVEGFTIGGTRCWLAGADALKAIIAGELGADVEYSPLLGPQVYDVALQGLNGATGVPKFIAVKEDRIMASQGADAFLRCGSVKY